MKIVMIVLCLISVSFLYSTIINIPDDQPTIQAGINVSVSSDTVLVQPGNYAENINYNGMNITVASLFLTTQDTTYISQTIIDGNQSGAVVTFESGENLNANLAGFTITNGTGNPFQFYDPETGTYWTEYRGGGIYIDNSSPSLLSVNVTVNWANDGGGIYSKNSQYSLSNSMIYNNYAETQSNIFISYGGFGGGIINVSSNSSYENVQVMNNTANYYGGGIYVGNSTPQFNNVGVFSNTCSGDGGGLYCSGSTIENLIISNNNAYRGGGIRVSVQSSDSTIRNVIIYNNISSYGGGICTYGWSSTTFHLNMENITIWDNEASKRGGGIYNNLSLCNFSTTDLSSIFSNKSPIGHDIYTNIDMEIVVDTFTVITPTSYHIYPLDSFLLQINNGFYNQVSSDLFVSPSGNDLNSGLSEDDPLRTIQKACSIILANSNNPKTINLLAGTYNRTETGDYFPITLQNHTSLVGVNEEQVILDAEEYAGVIRCFYADDVSFSNFTAKNGNTQYGGGFYCNYSTFAIEKVTITNNHASEGGGINCWEYAYPTLNNVTIKNNYADIRGGGFLSGTSYPHLKKVSITNNEAIEKGGGLFLYASSQSLLENVTIADNYSAQGGGIYSQLYCETNLINCLIWGNSPEQIYCYENYPSTILSFAYSDIMGGLDAIVTNNNATINWLDNNINIDPLLNPDYSISTNSPCFDTGTAYFEWNNEIWINLDPTEYYGVAPDMGAFEYGYVGNNQYEINTPSNNFTLSNYPNPFNPSTSIVFSIRNDSKIDLTIFNIKGQRIKELVQNDFTKGSHSIVWNGEDDNNKSVSSGIYYYKLKVNGKTEAVKKCLLLK